jgi:hypothetical protein
MRRYMSRVFNAELEGQTVALRYRYIERYTVETAQTWKNSKKIK